jgi:hypothetical protein
MLRGHRQEELCKDTIRVVVLDGCYPEAQVKVIVKKVRWAVGMSQDIGEEAPITFTSEFYRGVAQGRSVQDAFDLGVDRLAVEGVAGAKALVRLHKRPDVHPLETVLDEAESSDHPVGSTLEEAVESGRLETFQPVRHLRENRMQQGASEEPEDPDPPAATLAGR